MVGVSGWGEVEWGELVRVDGYLGLSGWNGIVFTFLEIALTRSLECFRLYAVKIEIFSIKNQMQANISHKCSLKMENFFKLLFWVCKRGGASLVSLTFQSGFDFIIKISTLYPLIIIYDVIKSCLTCTSQNIFINICS